MKLATMLAVLVALVAAATASASVRINGTDRVNASRACTSLRAASSSAFSTQYASFGACTSHWVHTANAARATALSACRSKGLRGIALSACVKVATAKTIGAEVLAAKNAAKACASERASLGDTAFEQKYGANGNLRNAFGKCVSMHVSGKTASSNGAQHFVSTITELNGSHVSGSGSLLLNGSKLDVKLSLTGLEGQSQHQLAIRSLGACPTMAADTNHDGTISLSEGQAVFGDVLLGLDSSTLASSGWSTTIQSSLLPLQTRTIVVLGMTVNGTYDATLPVACGTIAVK